MSKPGAFALTKYANGFVSANKPLLVASLKIIFPMVLLLSLINQVAVVYREEWVTYVTVLPTFIIYGCLVLTWHRASLSGDFNQKVIHPFNLTRGDFKFVGIFILLTGIFSAYLAGIDYGMCYLHAKNGGTLPPAILAGSIIPLLLGMYAFIRLSFIFPAQSVGVTLPLRELLRASKGMTWPMMGAAFIYGFLFVVLLIVYRLVVEVVMGVVSGGEADMKAYQAILASFVLAIPLQLCVVVLYALLTSALSKAYRWGMENNSLT